MAGKMEVDQVDAAQRVQQDFGNRIIDNTDITNIRVCFGRNPVLGRNWSRLWAAFGLDPIRQNQIQTQLFGNFMTYDDMYTEMIQGWIGRLGALSIPTAPTVNNLLAILVQEGFQLTADHIVLTLEESNR